MWMSDSFQCQAEDQMPGSPEETYALTEWAVHIQWAQHLQAATSIPTASDIVHHPSESPPAFLCMTSHAETWEPYKSAFTFQVHTYAHTQGMAPAFTTPWKDISENTTKSSAIQCVQ